MAAARRSDPTVAPPASTGTVPGLGEAFRMNLNTGQGVYAYALSLPAGVAGHAPRLSLAYRHGARSGPFGFGWRLDVRSIERRLELGVSASAPEVFLDGDREITALVDGSLGALREGAFSRYTRAGDGWRVEERNGEVHELGTTAAARVADPQHAERVQSWLLERSIDVSGNVVAYSWDLGDGSPLLAEVRYAAYAVRFVYEPRPDVRRDGRAGFLRALARRCARIDLVLDPGPAETRLRSWALTYDASGPSGLSLLGAVQLSCFATSADKGGDVVRPPVRFTYTSFDPGDVAVQFYGAEGSAPPPLDDPSVVLITLDQAPLPGVLQIVEGRQVYWRNGGSGWEGPEVLPAAPFGGSISSAGAVFIDAAGNGKPDLVLLSPAHVRGYFENAGREGWGRFVAYPRGATATPDWSSSRLRFADVDMDGRIDAIASVPRGLVVWRNAGALGWEPPTWVPAPADGGGIDFSNPLVMLADMTGDGSADIVHVTSGAVRYWPNLGNGRFGEAINMANSPRLRGLSAGADRVVLADVDGDGCADLVLVGAEGVTIAMNRSGAGFAAPVVLGPIPAPIPGTVRVANLRGTATAGLVWNSYRSGGKVGYVRCELNASGSPYLLTRVDNGSGLVSEIFYRSAIEDYLEDRRSGRGWDTNFPFPMTVVARTRETDLVTGAVREISFRYHDAHYEPHGRRFSGFRTAEQIEEGDESRADVLSVHRFLVDMEHAPGNTRDHAALDGLLARIDVYSLDGSALQHLPLSTEESEYAVTVLADAADGRHRSFVTVTTHRTLDIERSTDVRIEEKTYTYGPWGNVVREVHRASGTRDGVAQAEAVRVTEVTYATSTTRRLLDRPARVVVRDAIGNILSETRTFYDGPDFVGLPLGQADRGLSTRKLELAWSEEEFAAHHDAGVGDATELGFIAGEDADGHGARFIAAERHAYDARGLDVGTMDPLGVTEMTAFDEDGLFPTAVTGPLGTTSYIHDRAAGQPSQITYPGGAAMRFVYDAQGRLRWSLVPGDDPARPPRQYTYHDAVVPNVRTTRMLQSRSGETLSTTHTYFDGRGNDVQQAAQVDATRYVVSGRRLYNPWGNVKRETEPQWSSDGAFAPALPAGAKARSFAYDGRGRLTKTVDYNDGVSTARYFPFRVELADANDNDTSPENVARGQAGTTRREELDVLLRRSAIVQTLGDGAARTTRYVSDALGRIVEIHDDAGLLCSYRYDRRGNRYDIAHRAAGRRRLWHDARGRVVRSLDANGNDLRVTMDRLGRTRRLSREGVVLEEYTYDEGGPGALGQVSSMTYRGGSQSHGYDAAGRLSWTEHRFDGVAGAQTIAYERDPLGREVARVCTDGTRIERTLTWNGWVSAIAGVLADVTYDPRGLPQTITYANGVVSTIEYLAGPGRVSRRRTVGPHGELYEDVSYECDRMGMLLKSSDVAPEGRGVASYAFDPLYQLVSCTSGDPQAPTVRTYGYEGFTNLARMDETNSVLAFDDDAHPDRISGISVGGGPRRDVPYDANGNLLALAGRSFRYNEKNELSGVAREDGLVATYAYDPRGSRVSKRVTDAGGDVTTTLFVGAEIEIRGGVTYHYVHLGAQRVCMLGPDGPRFFHTDHAGSTVFFTDAGGVKRGSIAYRPFGDVERSDGVVDQRVFGMHPFDAESGLYYMRRRYYAPELGRFLTPDPLAVYRPDGALGTPLALHPYAYAGNDPLDNVDPDGLSFWSVLGAIVGVAAGIGLGLLVGLIGGPAGVVVGVAAAIALTTISYSVASQNAGKPGGELFRGFMVGFNAGLNGYLGGRLFGYTIAFGLAGINFLASIDGNSRDKSYQGLLGWTSWLMPMSWGGQAVGLVVFTFYYLPSTGKNISIGMDWRTGTILLGNADVDKSFSMGNFAFLRSSDDARHEAGHTLSTAAFGSVFLLVGAMDELGKKNAAYAEWLADSHDPSIPEGDVNMWRPRW